MPEPPVVKAARRERDMNMFNARIMSLVLILGLAVCSLSQGRIIYVDDDAPLGGDGASWSGAYKYLQDALAVAQEGDEVRVAQGIYNPDCNAFSPSGSGDREASFKLSYGLTLKGGYAGLVGVDPNAWDVELYDSILSGDLAGNDSPIQTLIDLQSDTTHQENSRHVVTVAGPCVLEGVTISGGQAVGDSVCLEQCDPIPMPAEEDFSGAGLLIMPLEEPDDYQEKYDTILVRHCVIKSNYSDNGAGVYIEDCDLELGFEKCVITENIAYQGGGGVFSDETSTCVFMCCEISSNVCQCWGGACCVYSSEDAGMEFNETSITDNMACLGYGGGIFLTIGEIRLNKCDLSGNQAREEGGAIDEEYGDVVLSQCYFAENQASKGGAVSARNGEFYQCQFLDNQSICGGAIYHVGHYARDGVFKHCLFSGNIAKEQGGAVYCAYGKESFVNCTMVGNRSPEGSFLANEESPISGRDHSGRTRGEIEIANSIVSGTDEIIWNTRASIEVQYSTISTDVNAIQDPFDRVTMGLGSLDADPCFVDTGYWDSNDTSDDPNDDFYVVGGLSS